MDILIIVGCTVAAVWYLYRRFVGNARSDTGTCGCCDCGGCTAGLQKPSED